MGGFGAWWQRARGSAWIDLPLRTWNGVANDGVARMAAALSYYTVFSLAPLLVLVLALLGLVFDRTQLQDHLLHEVGDLMGSTAAGGVEQLLTHAVQPGAGASAVIGLGILLIAALGVLVELKNSLNSVWHVRAKPGQSWLAMALRYLAPLTMILGIGFLLLVSLLMSALIAGVSQYVGHLLPGTTVLMRLVDQLAGLAVVSLLFALIFRLLPDVRLSWRDVWLGAVVAAGLFTLGRWLIGVYLGRASFSSSYGAAGSVVVVLAWVYWSAQILLIGAEFTRAVVERAGRPIEPKDHAELASAPGCLVTAPRDAG